MPVATQAISLELVSPLTTMSTPVISLEPVPPITAHPVQSSELGQGLIPGFSSTFKSHDSYLTKVCMYHHALIKLIHV